MNKIAFKKLMSLGVSFALVISTIVAPIGKSGIIDNIVMDVYADTYVDYDYTIDDKDSSDNQDSGFIIPEVEVKKSNNI